MSKYANTIALSLMMMIIYFCIGWISPLQAELGFKFYILCGLLAGGAHVVGQGLVKAALLTKLQINGATA